MQLVIRPLRGTTKLLSSLAQTSQSSFKSQILIEGPYGASRSFLDSLRAYHRILLVAGGVGATFTLPIYRHLQQQQKQQQQQQPSGSARTIQQIRFVWSVRSIADASWGLEQLQHQEDGDYRSNKSSSASSSSRQQDTGLASHPTSNTSNSTNSCDIYISSPSSNSSPPLFPPSPSPFSSTLELHPRPPPTLTPSSSTSYKIHTGRPNLRTLVDEIFTEVNDTEVGAGSESDEDHYEAEDGAEVPAPSDSSSYSSKSTTMKVAVLVCGPVGMGAALRREVGRWVRRGRGGTRNGEEEWGGNGDGEGEGEEEGKGRWDIFWHDEEFGW